MAVLGDKKSNDITLNDTMSDDEVASVEPPRYLFQLVLIIYCITVKSQISAPGAFEIRIEYLPVFRVILLCFH